VSELPEGWVGTNLGKLVTLKYGKSLPQSQRIAGSFSVYGSNGPIGSHIKPLITGPAIIIGRKGSIGELHFTENPCYPIDTTYFINDFFGQSPRFIFFLLKKLGLTELNRASAIPGLNREDAYALPILLPPIPEQQRIVAKLDRLFEHTRRAREELAQIPRLIEHYKQAFLGAAFRGELTPDWRKDKGKSETAAELIDRTPEPTQPRGGREATETVIPGIAALSVNVPESTPPDGWAWVSLRRIARQETGHTPSRKHPEYWGGDIPWLSIPDAASHHGGIINDTTQHPTQLGIDNSSARVLPADTICLSRTASVGYIVRMGRPMATSQDFVTWTCTEALDPDYLLYALLAEGDDIRRFGKGSTHTTIYFPEVRALHICLAPIEEQREIVARVKAALDWAEHICNEVERTAALVPKLDQATLAKAFRGELVPQDPNDEPAAKLLERIRAARAAEPKPKRRREARL
jgi:type I restriction enzyme S subunit